MLEICTQWLANSLHSLQQGDGLITVWCKILTGENIDEFDEFLAIRQYFPYQHFPFR